MDDYASRIENYRNKAEELRVLSQSMSSPEAREMFLDMASDYLQMAHTLERIAADRPPPDSKL